MKGTLARTELLSGSLVLCSGLFHASPLLDQENVWMRGKDVKILRRKYLDRFGFHYSTTPTDTSYKLNKITFFFKKLQKFYSLNLDKLIS